LPSFPFLPFGWLPIASAFLGDLSGQRLRVNGAFSPACGIPRLLKMLMTRSLVLAAVCTPEAGAMGAPHQQREILWD
jgi:hypothetical protein